MLLQIPCFVYFIDYLSEYKTRRAGSELEGEKERERKREDFCKKWCSMKTFCGSKCFVERPKVKGEISEKDLTYCKFRHNNYRKG